MKLHWIFVLAADGTHERFSHLWIDAGEVLVVQALDEGRPWVIAGVVIGLHTCDHAIFPALEAAFDYSTRTPLILVAGLCTPAEIRAVGIEGVTAHLTANKAWPPGVAKTAATALALAHAQQLALPGQDGTAALVKRTAAKLLELDREIKDLDKTIAERFRDHPYARIIESLPGFGPNLGAEFLVITRSDSASFAPAGRPASYAGLLPVPQGIRVASAALCAGRNASTGACGGCSIWRRCLVCAPAARLGRSTIANAANASSIARQCSPWRGAWSTCCGHYRATAGNSPSTSPRSPPWPDGRR